MNNLHHGVATVVDENQQNLILELDISKK